MKSKRYTDELKREAVKQVTERAPRVRLYREPKKRVRWLTEEETGKLLQGVAGTFGGDGYFYVGHWITAA